MTAAQRTAPPASPAPSTAVAPDGSIVDLVTLARAICALYHEEFPDEQGRYGDAGHEWCVHDNQYLLLWAIHDAALDDQVAWLARILAAREFPLERLRRDLELAAEAVGATGAPWAGVVAERLLAARGAVRNSP